MTAELGFVAAFMVGLLGSVHCIGMCGGIVGILTSSLEQRPEKGLSRLPNLLLYNGGRIISYAIAGAIAGFLGNGALSVFSVQRVSEVGIIVSGAFMIMLGLYLADWWRGLAKVEAAGGVIWSKLQPLTRRLLPIKSSWHVFLMGLVWGWLPCGLVYATLMWALFSADPVYSALLMVAFGAGTLPMLLSLGSATDFLNRARTNPMVRRSAGVVILVFGVLMFGGLAHPPHVDVIESNMICVT